MTGNAGTASAGNGKKLDVRKLTTMGMLAAIGVVLVALIRFPIFPAAPFLEYDPADIPILVCTMIYGPLAGLVLTVVVSFLQAVLFSSGSSWIGFVMHVVATGAMCMVAGSIYNRTQKTMSGAAVSLAAGVVTMVSAMVGMNLVLTPVFMHAPMESVINMLVPVIIPFNMIKAGANSTVTFLIFKFIQKIAVR